MAIAIAIPLALGAAGTAWGMSADAYGTRPIKDLIPPKPSDESLPKAVNKILTGTQGGTESPDEGTTDSSATNDRGATNATSGATDAGSLSGLTWSWSVPYGGWRRFLQTGEFPYGGSSVSYASVPAQVVPSVGATTVATVTASLPRTPAYLWILLPLGLVLVWAAGLAVFEPVQGPGSVSLAIRSVRRAARDLPAGMTRSAGRTMVRVLRRFLTWGRR
jgi:hypothetical protein